MVNESIYVSLPVLEKWLSRIESGMITKFANNRDVMLQTIDNLCIRLDKRSYVSEIDGLRYNQTNSFNYASICVQILFALKLSAIKQLLTLNELDERYARLFEIHGDNLGYELENPAINYEHAKKKTTTKKVTNKEPKVKTAKVKKPTKVKLKIVLDLTKHDNG